MKNLKYIVNFIHGVPGERTKAPVRKIIGDFLNNPFPIPVFEIEIAGFTNGLVNQVGGSHLHLVDFYRSR